MPVDIWGNFVPLNPSGCRHCGFGESNHCDRWSPQPVGWHTWTEPTKEQRYERIRTNAADRKRYRVV